MAMTPLPGVGGTLFGAGGGAADSNTQTPFEAPGGIKTPSFGKNSSQQNLHSPHSGLRSTITKGDPLSRMMGQYGKGHSFSPAGQGAGLSQIRGGMGQMRRIRGGLGPGKVGQAGPSNTDYSMTSPDSE
jgi:hypothetical protein